MQFSASNSILRKTHGEKGDEQNGNSFTLGLGAVADPSYDALARSQQFVERGIKFPSVWTHSGRVYLVLVRF